MGRAVPERQLVAARRAVAVVFLLNAVAYANVVPRLPAIKAELGLTNTSLGVAVAAIAFGALVSGTAAGWLVDTFGSARLAVGCGVGFGLLLPGFALAPGWPALVAVGLLLGALDSWMDVAMNAHALRVERGYRRSIINGLHGVWSIGAVLGGSIGTVAAAAGLDLTLHLTAAGSAIVVTALLARPHLLPGPDFDAVPHGAATPPAHPDRALRTWALVVLGGIVLLSAVIEDAPQSWGAVLLRGELGAAAGVAGMVYLAFQSAMTVSRLVGDRLVDRWGPVTVVRLGGLVTAISVSLGLLAGEPAAVIVAFGLAGAGTALLFPLVFQAAGNLPGTSTGLGVAVTAWLGRVGFLLAPPLIGLVGDAVSLRAGLAVVPLAGLGVALLSGALAPPAATST